MVESIEGLETELETEAFLDRKGLIKGGVEVRLPGTEDRIFARAAEALVEAPCPRWKRVCKSGGVEPLLLLLRIGNLTDQVGAVGVTAAQSDRIVVDVKSGPLVVDEQTCLEDHGP